MAVGVLLAACGKPEAVDDPSAYPKTEAGKILKSSRCAKIVNVLWDTTFAVTAGLDYYQMQVMTDASLKQDIYLLRADPSRGLDIKVAISNETTPSAWYRQKLSVMAEGMDTPSKPVYAMINADFCVNDPPIHPRGPVHCGGTVWASTFDFDPKLDQQGLSYIGITGNGRMTIAPRGNYESEKASLRECTGAGVLLVRNSVVKDGYGDKRDPRTAVGYTDENIVWMLAVDGRHKTTGMTYAEMASVFSALGCVNAANLDGGGSTQMLVRNPLTDKIEMRNWPSDPTDGEGGEERARLNAWAIVKK